MGDDNAVGQMPSESASRTVIKKLIVGHAVFSTMCAYIAAQRPERPHKGSCNPEAGCDASCADYASVSSTCAAVARGVDTVKEAQSVIAYLQASLQVRTWHPGFPARPVEFQPKMFGAAYDKGFFEGWRGVKADPPYNLGRHRNAYTAGHAEGVKQSAAEIKRMAEGLLQESSTELEMQRSSYELGQGGPSPA